MENKKQTAVEWLVYQLLSQKGMVIISTSTFFLNEEVINKAKEMEKEQMIKAYNKSFELRDKPYETAEKYYKETYE